MKKKVAIIGAGVAGIMMAKTLLDKHIDITLFESNSCYGGQWRYNAHSECIDIRKDNTVLSSAMYACMRTNLPTLMMVFPGHTYPDVTPTFPTHHDVLTYIQSYVDKHGLEKYIKYDKEVINIIKNNTRWAVITKDGSAEHFDYIAVCTGTERSPYIPKLPGMHLFAGNIIHSSSYRTPAAFKNKNVVILGASHSGQDISLDISRTAKHVYFCGQFKDDNHSCPKQSVPYGQYRNITQHACIASINSDSVSLKDKTVLNNVDTIILCTGYDYDLPFLKGIQKDIQISGKYIGPLYLDMFYPRDPSLMLIGLPKRASYFYMVSLQSAYCAKIIEGTARLPDYQHMIAAIQNHLATLENKDIPLQEALNYGKDRQYAYHRLLCSLSDRDYDGGVERIREALFHHKKRYLSSYRDKPFIDKTSL